jgi:DNA-binding transcriptional LysR family regulator
MHIPPLHLLQTFESVARLSSMADAARELNVTPSAVSHRVREIEALTGCPLFARGKGRALALTVAGTHYLAQVREALGKLALLARPRLGDAPPERLRVVAPPTFARQLLVGKLAEFGALFPKAQLEFSLSIPFSELRATDADVEVRFDELQRLPQGAVALFEEHVFPVASRAYIAQHGGRTPWPPQHIARARLLRSPSDGWAAWFGAAGFATAEPQAGPLFNDLGLVIEAAAAGQGVALARHRLADAWLTSGAVKPVSTVAVPSPLCYAVVLRKGAPPIAEHFRSWLVALFS